MIEETAVIANCEGKFALAAVERSSDCNSCSVREGCGTATLTAAKGKRQEKVRVLNPIGALPGERVVIGFGESALTKASLAFYAAPLAGLILVALLGQGIAQWMDLPSEPLSVLGALLGLAAGFLWLRHFTARVSRDERYQAVVLRRAEGPRIVARSG